MYPVNGFLSFSSLAAEGLRTHVVVVVVVLAVSAALVAVLMFWLCRGTLCSLTALLQHR